MQRSCLAALAAVVLASAARADFTPTVLDQFSGSVGHTLTTGGTFSFGAGNIAGANWAGFGAAGGTKSFGGDWSAESTGYGPETVFASMAEAGGFLALGLIVPTGGTLDSGSIPPTNARVDYTGAFDLSGKGGSFYFTFASVSGPGSGTVLRISITAASVAYSADVAVNATGPRHKELAFGALRSSGGAFYTGNGSNLSAVSIALVATGNLDANRTASLSEFGIIPTPASAALLGAAGILARRRRRR